MQHNWEITMKTEEIQQPYQTMTYQERINLIQKVRANRAIPKQSGKSPKRAVEKKVESLAEKIKMMTREEREEFMAMLEEK